MDEASVHTLDSLSMYCGGWQLVRGDCLDMDPQIKLSPELPSRRSESRAREDLFW